MNLWEPREGKLSIALPIVMKKNHIFCCAQTHHSQAYSSQFQPNLASRYDFLTDLALEGTIVELK